MNHKAWKRGLKCPHHPLSEYPPQKVHREMHIQDVSSNCTAAIDHSLSPQHLTPDIHIGYIVFCTAEIAFLTVYVSGPLV